jgi:hypothetical protein
MEIIITEHQLIDLVMHSEAHTLMVKLVSLVREAIMMEEQLFMAEVLVTQPMVAQLLHRLTVTQKEE